MYLSQLSNTPLPLSRHIYTVQEKIDKKHLSYCLSKYIKYFALKSGFQCGHTDITFHFR